jgi:hypothetical protein
MADYYALTSEPLPTSLHGADAEYSIRTLSERERLAIEDHFFSKGLRIALNSGITAVVVPQNQTANASMEDFAVLIEFALGVLAVSGFQAVTLVATLGTSGCGDALQRAYSEVALPPKFPRKVVKAAASAWVRHFFIARQNTKDKLHIAADRFVRYLRMNSSHDALVDLCICLESLIESETEIAFRFSTCLAKIVGGTTAEEISWLLKHLYDLRSKVVHGTDSTREYRKIEPSAEKLRAAARTILTTYVLYTAEHTKDEWKKKLRSSLFREE